jgi:hypothetical protein
MRRDETRPFMQLAAGYLLPGFSFIYAISHVSLIAGGIRMFHPTLEEVAVLAENYSIIPVSMEVYADMETPISLLKRYEDSKYCFLLESVEGGEKWARFSFIGKNRWVEGAFGVFFGVSAMNPPFITLILT